MGYGGNSGIGITFLPSDEQAANGSLQGQAEGDLGQALKILSLHLPRILGSHAPVSRRLLDAPGFSAGFNPNSAVLETLLRMAGLSGRAVSGGQGGGLTGPPDTHVGFPSTAPSIDAPAAPIPSAPRDIKGPYQRTADQW